MKLTFNAASLALGAVLPQPTVSDLETPCYRHAGLELVREDSSDYVKSVLAAVPLRGDRRWVGVDVEVGWVEAGKRVGTGLWHVDTVTDLRHPSRPERHHLFVSGQACLTEFLAEPLELELDPSEEEGLRRARLDADVRRAGVNVRALQSCQITSYGRLHLHRAALATHDELRLRVRVTETDVLRPSWGSLTKRHWNRLLAGP